MQRLFALMLVTILPGLPGAEAAESRSTLALDWQGVRLEGTELGRGGGMLQLLGRDGRMWSLPAAEAKSVRTLPLPFHSYTAMEMREQLTRELGKTFEVTATGHYLVAHPRGQRDAWSQRFDDLYRHFIHYFSVRGFQPKEPEFPLVAIVWPNQQEYLRYAHRDGNNIGTNVLGYYSPKTNRITLYDIGGGQANSAAWHQNADTIIHEATHQTAGRFQAPGGQPQDGLRGRDDQFGQAVRTRSGQGLCPGLGIIVLPGRDAAPALLRLFETDGQTSGIPGVSVRGADGRLHVGLWLEPADIGNALRAFHGRAEVAKLGGPKKQAGRLFTPLAD